MTVRGAQFPMVNEAHFNEGLSGGGTRLNHLSQHGDYTVKHRYSPGTAHGQVDILHPTHGPVASLDYDIGTVPRATSLKPQPVAHTGYIHVDEEHRNRGLAQHMQSVLASAHPGAPNIASNELTTEGAAWRGRMARTGRDPGNGERIGQLYDQHGDPQGEHVFRPAKGQPKDALVGEPDLFYADPSDSKVAKGRRR